MVGVRARGPGISSITPRVDAVDFSMLRPARPAKQFLRNDREGETDAPMRQFRARRDMVASAAAAGCGLRPDVGSGSFDERLDFNHEPANAFQPGSDLRFRITRRFPLSSRRLL
jgi:hypothetical protein